MPKNAVRVTLQIRNDEAANWLLKNPTLTRGEFGLESDTSLMKVGDGVTAWSVLPYLNKINNTYFQRQSDGTLTFSDEFIESLTGGTIIGAQYPISNNTYADILITNNKLQVSKITATGNINDLVQDVDSYVIFNCGSSTDVI